MRSAAIRRVVALCLAIAAPVAAQERLDPTAATPHLPADPGGSLRHALSGFRFAARLGQMSLHHKLVYAPDDVAAQYRGDGPADHAPALDLILYRATRPLAEETAGNVEAIRRQWTAMTPLAAPPPLPPRARGGMARWFHASLAGVPMRTGFVMVERDGWWIEARGSAPDAGGEAGFQRLLDAIEAIDWSLGATVAARDAARLMPRLPAPI